MRRRSRMRFGRAERRRIRHALAISMTLAAVVGCTREGSEGGASETAAVVSDAAMKQYEAEQAEELKEVVAQLEAAKTPDEIGDALSDLAILQNPSAFPAIAKYFEHSDPAVAERAVETVELIGTEQCIPVLKEALSKPLPVALKVRVLEAIYSNRTEPEDESAVTAALVVGLADPDPVVRREAALQLGSLYDVGALDRLKEQLARETDPDARRIMQWAVAFLQDETKEPPPSS